MNKNLDTLFTADLFDASREKGNLLEFTRISQQKLTAESLRSDLILHLIRGFLIMPPVDPDDIEARLRRQGACDGGPRA